MDAVAAAAVRLFMMEAPIEGRRVWMVACAFECAPSLELIDARA
jgi:hypothetical protein